MTTTQRLRLVHGSGQVVAQQTTLDDLLDEVFALSAEAVELVERALPLAYRLRLMANALGPTSGVVAQELVDLLERHERRHSPERAA